MILNNLRHHFPASHWPSWRDGQRISLVRGSGHRLSLAQRDGQMSISRPLLCPLLVSSWTGGHRLENRSDGFTFPPKDSIAFHRSFFRNTPKSGVLMTSTLTPSAIGPPDMTPRAPLYDVIRASQMTS